MKIHISYKFQKGTWGGGNQFLKALKKEFVKMNLYEENPEKAEIILLNSHHNFDETFRLKIKYPQKIIIHRIDGPIQIIRGKDKILDKVILQFNNLVADGIVFQSNWSRNQNKKLFGISTEYETVIHNASDNEIFNKNNKREFNPNDKIKLIATSWSSNWRKGFDIYKYLDENLNFNKYGMTFVGNLPIEFRNIKWIKPILPEKLAEILKHHDIYVTASQGDPCSNSLIEALSCGLPAVTLNNGGHPELVQKGGELFNSKEDIIEKIEKVAQNYYYYQSQTPEFSIKKVAQEYYELAKRIYNDVKDKRYQSKQVKFSTKINFYKMNFMISKWKGLNKLTKISKKLWILKN